MSLLYHMIKLSSTWPDLLLELATEMPPDGATPCGLDVPLKRFSDFAFRVFGVIGASFDKPFLFLTASAASGVLDVPR